MKTLSGSRKKQFENLKSSIDQLVSQINVINVNQL